MDHEDARDDRRVPDLRVGDADRTAALDALGVHLGAGRLDVDEFGDRSERAAVAVRRSELEALFVDLPAPHPPLPHPPSHAPGAEAAQRARAVPSPPRPHHGAPAPVLALVMALVLLLPIVAAGIGTGFPAGVVLIPLLFVALAHGRRGRWHGGGPRDRW